jgi:tRNA pseudouridine55 synthase
MAITTMQQDNNWEGILPINKQRGITAFHLVRVLRRCLGVQKIGHAGTLDPFASGVMVMLIGRKYTRLSDLIMAEDKEYQGRIHLGIITDTFDCEGKILHRSDLIPTLEEVHDVLQSFQGKKMQLPPMFSAKKVNGKKLYELARAGKTVERKPAKVKLATEVLAYNYPYLDIRVRCSKGTYIRTLAHDFGTLLGCGGHLTTLTRTHCGIFTVDKCFQGEHLQSKDFQAESLKSYLVDASAIHCKVPLYPSELKI